MTAGESPLAAPGADVRIPPPLMYAVPLVLLWLLDRIIPLRRPADGWRASIGWVLVASGKDTKGYKEAHDKRKTGVSITAVLAGEPEVKKDDAGKEYKEVKVSEVSVG